MSDPRSIIDIEEAIVLFEEAESGFPSERSAARFREAFDTLAYYLQAEDPSEKIRAFISNLKFSYTRGILSKLNDIQLTEVDVLMPYLRVMFISAKEEFDGLRLSHPEIAEEFDACLERFRPQLEDVIRQ